MGRQQGQQRWLGQQEECWTLPGGGQVMGGGYAEEALLLWCSACCLLFCCSCCLLTCGSSARCLRENQSGLPTLPPSPLGRQTHLAQFTNLLHDSVELLLGLIQVVPDCRGSSQEQQQGSCNCCCCRRLCCSRLAGKTQAVLGVRCRVQGTIMESKESHQTSSQRPGTPPCPPGQHLHTAAFGTPALCRGCRPSLQQPTEL